jgi:membrane-associated phospholipid phosphatase
VRVSEWVAAAYFAYLFGVALITLGGPRRRAAATGSALAVVAVLLLAGTVPDTPSWRGLRDWLPAGYLLGGYWLSGLYFVAPMPNVERRFLACDRWLYRAGLATLVARAPRALLEMLEFAYLVCFVFVPGGMLLLWLGGASASADRFWTVVLASEFGSFGMLPWIQTRPPRDVEPPGAIDRRAVSARWINQYMVRHTSIGVNTFPSGHVAGALATALAVSEALPALELPLLIGAGLIAVSTVIGRYHYAVDAVAGALLTLGIWALMHAV